MRIEEVIFSKLIIIQIALLWKTKSFRLSLTDNHAERVNVYPSLHALSISAKPKSLTWLPSQFYEDPSKAVNSKFDISLSRSHRRLCQ